MFSVLHYAHKTINDNQSQYRQRAAHLQIIRLKVRSKHLWRSRVLCKIGVADSVCDNILFGQQQGVRLAFSNTTESR
jgi:hypothetical protein